jgi:hypothetical protein
MTDRIGIDAQIASLEELVQASKFASIDCKVTEAILETLRDYKRIVEAKVQEPKFRRFHGGLKPVDRGAWVNGPCGFYHDAEVDAHIDTLLDLLRRETAKNERIKELLKDPTQSACDAGMKILNEVTTGDAHMVFTAMSAALLAEIEK